MPDLHIDVILSTLLYTALGLALFGASLWLATTLSPFSIRKEVEEDQNPAVGMIIGSMFIGIAIIVASAIH